MATVQFPQCDLEVIIVVQITTPLWYRILDFIAAKAPVNNSACTLSAHGSILFSDLIRARLKTLLLMELESHSCGARIWYSWGWLFSRDQSPTCDSDQVITPRQM